VRPGKWRRICGPDVGAKRREDYIANMNATLTLDEAGRVVIPQELRDALHLNPGDRLELESQGERITLRPVPSTGTMVKEDGVWVFRTGKPLSAEVAETTLDRVRIERDGHSQSEQS
jgi:AbrB family looped-hinge helix DNA binding protein